MRILVAGSLPPPANGHRASLLDAVVRLRRDGDAVEVVSLDHVSAAHRYLSAPGLPAVLEVGLAARRFDSVVIQIEPGLPVRAHAGRVERAAALFAFAFLLRRLPEVTLRWDRSDDLPGGAGGRAALALWATARRIEIGPDVDSDMLAGLLPDGRRRLELVRPGAALAIVPRESHRTVGEMSAAHVNEIVRGRAAASRQALHDRPRRAQEDGAAVVRVEQWEWLPSPGLGVPDLGSLRQLDSPRTAGFGSIRAQAAHGLAVAERHAATRPAAQLVRLVLSQLRAVRKAP